MAVYSDLDDEMAQHLDAHVEWVEGWIDPEAKQKYDGLAGAIVIVQLILDSGELAVEDTVKLQALGNYLGLAISKETGWPLRGVEDEYGKDLAIVFLEPDGFIFPTTLISKRVEQGHQVDVQALALGLIESASAAREQASG